MNERLVRALSRTLVIGTDVLDCIPIRECGEPLVELSSDAPGVFVGMSGPRLEYAGKQVLYARESVRSMLEQAGQSLTPDYTLFVTDAYRPITYQRMIYQSIYGRYESEFPGSSQEEIQSMVYPIIFPPSENPNTPPGHSTGGAVDVFLVGRDGCRLDMGSQYLVCDEEQSLKHHTNAQNITPKQRENRVVLVSAMIEAGFSNFPGEWWHFMFGDREYAAYEGYSEAIYGRADLLPNFDIGLP